MADLQQTADQLKARAQDLTKQAQSQLEELRGQAEKQVKNARELSKFAGDAAQKGGKIVSTSAEKLAKNEADALKGGYVAVVDQLKGFKEVKDLDGLKAILKTQAEELSSIGQTYASNGQRSKIAKKARTDLSKIVNQVKAKVSGTPATKAAPKKAAAKKPAAKKTAAKKPAAKKAATAKA